VKRAATRAARRLGAGPFVDTLLRRPGWRSGLELGVWLGAMLLVRSQLLVMAVAAMGTLVVCAALAKRVFH